MIDNNAANRPIDLRTRIAAVIDREVDGFWEPLDVADAVIAELGLREERADKQHPMHVCATPGLHHRYVTEWQADD